MILHEVCVRVFVRYVITKFSRMDSLPHFLTHGAPQARASRARELHYNVTINSYLKRLSLRSYLCLKYHNESVRKTLNKFNVFSVFQGLEKCLFFFFTPILRQDHKNVVFPRGVVKDICVQLDRYIQDSFCHLVLLISFFGSLFEK